MMTRWTLSRGLGSPSRPLYDELFWLLSRLAPSLGLALGGKSPEELVAEINRLIDLGRIEITRTMIAATAPSPQRGSS